VKFRSGEEKQERADRDGGVGRIENGKRKGKYFL
jgi:hypothetical protein